MKASINPPSRTSLIAQELVKAGRAMTIQELNQVLKIPVVKLRNSLTNYHSAVVRVGDSLYDLRTRAYVGKKIRVRPTQEDIAKGRVSLCEDASMFFEGMLFGENKPIELVSDSEITVNLKRNRKPPYSRTLPLLGPWYKRTGFKFGDDIIFICQNIETHRFFIDRMTQSERDKLAITVANRGLADAAHAALNHEMSKYGMDIFMIRNYFYLYSPATTPDSLIEVLQHDPRFINNFSDNMVSSTGYIMGQDIPSHGLRKYYYQHHSHAQVLVEILTDDEFGERYGACSLCWQRMKWESWCGWRHCYDDFEWLETEISTEFKGFVPTKETILAFKEASSKCPQCPEEPKRSKSDY